MRRVCFPRRVSIASNAALLDAALQLGLVQSVIGAMRTADLAAAVAAGPLPGGWNAAQAPAAVTPSASGPAATYEPCRPSSPSPCYQPRPIDRPVLHPLPQPPTHHRAPACDQVCVNPPATADAGHRLCNPIQPPWKVLPWPKPCVNVVVVKKVARRIDEDRTGTLIDMFV